MKQSPQAKPRPSPSARVVAGKHRPPPSTRRPLNGVISTPAERATEMLRASPVLDGEDAAVYAELSKGVSDDLRPRDIVEHMWVRDIIDHAWDVRRLRQLKDVLLRDYRRDALAAILEEIITERGHFFIKAGEGTALAAAFSAGSPEA